MAYSVSLTYMIVMCGMIALGTSMLIFALNQKILWQWHIFKLNQNIPLLAQECTLNQFIDPHYSFAKQIIINSLTAHYMHYKEMIEEYHSFCSY